MADVVKCIDYALSKEDGMVSIDFDGKRIRFGIRERLHPELSNCMFFSSMGKVGAFEVAKAVYEEYYCQPLCIVDFKNQETANEVLLLSLSVGVLEAGRMVQRAAFVEGDGHIGPLTMWEIDNIEEKVFLDRLMSGMEV